MEIYDADDTEEHWYIERPVYWVTIWDRSELGQWSSRVYRIVDARDIAEVIEFANSKKSTTFIVAVEAIDDPHGRVVLMGSDPLPGSPIRFNCPQAES